MKVRKKIKKGIIIYPPKKLSKLIKHFAIFLEVLAGSSIFIMVVYGKLWVIPTTFPIILVGVLLHYHYKEYAEIVVIDNCKRQLNIKRGKNEIIHDFLNIKRYLGHSIASSLGGHGSLSFKLFFEDYKGVPHILFSEDCLEASEEEWKAFSKELAILTQKSIQFESFYIDSNGHSSQEKQKQKTKGSVLHYSLVGKSIF